jgi:hypothetical protein
MPRSSLTSDYHFVICQTPNILTDEILKAIGPSLVNLDNLNLTGCHEVTYHGVWATVSSSMNGNRRLTLEGICHKFVKLTDLFRLKFISHLVFRT